MGVGTNLPVTGDLGGSVGRSGNQSAGAHSGKDASNTREIIMKVPSYTKVLTIGSKGTERILTGRVVIEEKVDGSQFAFGIDENGEIGCRSHHQQIIMDEAGMFTEAAAHVQRIAPILERMYAVRKEPLWFYAEYLQRPKHNTLAYSRIPTNHLVLFDARFGMNWLPVSGVQAMADSLQMDAIPVLYQGNAPDMETVKSFLTRESYLGGPAIEGIVIKNYEELIALGGNTFPLFCKLVREAFKERNMKEWHANSGKSKLEELIASYCTTARWQKAVQHLTESGELEHEPRDIGKIMREISADLIEEEAENIKDALWELYRKDFVRSAQHGAAEWYKQYLQDAVNLPAQGDL